MSVTLPKHIRQAVERELKPEGMHLNDGKVRLSESHVQIMLRVIDSQSAELTAALAREAALKADVERFERESDERDKRADEILSTLKSQVERAEQAEAEVAALREDAERYRWLKAKSAEKHDYYADVERWMVSSERRGFGQNYFGDKIDAAIDKACKHENK